ncbi:alpha-ketoglutarate-dependent dioxygenase alkB homolog 6 isoform X2 [Ananas comosus]|uniref:Alpha-ketoglutarate-dependent dioxygenase alkB homolog 6 isoform X2 n=1 Tax=Ananas comosus TaxID=4615 RepID=A0A6P5GKK2_ANACO|nr:alpha-ketoglutarate-dependent dioxygenase alkB homolog 6 isoform X2 [Ananas comosus]
MEEEEAAAAAGAGEEESVVVKLEKHVVGSLPTLIYIPNFISRSDQFQLLHHIYEVSSSRWKSLKNRRLQNWGGVVHEKGLLPQQLPAWLTKITERICAQTGLFPSPINHVLINEYLPDQGIMPHQDGPAYFPVVAILSLGSPAVIDLTPHQRIKECAPAAVETEVSKERDRLSLTSEFAHEKNIDHHHLCSLLLMPCSLFVFKDQAYSDYLHGIEDSELQRLDKVVNISEVSELEQPNRSRMQDEAVNFSSVGQNGILQRTSTRVSLTCRLVPKVHRNLFKF